MVVKPMCGGILFRDFTPARVGGAFDFENGLTEPDQPYRMKLAWRILPLRSDELVDQVLQHLLTTRIESRLAV